MLETMTIGGGCFWCLEAVFEQVVGISDVRSGYAGGHDPAPTYERVCSGTTGHAEVVRITFDPAIVTRAEILRLFFTIHDPTTKDRQGPDIGPQYRSIILVRTEEERATVRAAMRAVEAEGIWSDPLVTEVVPLESFHEAEPEHHGYFRGNPGAPYCRFVVEPKVARARRTHARLFGG